MLAPRMYQQRIERAGCGWRPIPAGAEFDPSAGRAADEQREYMRETFLGSMLPDALAAEVAAGEPDVLMIDALLASTVCAGLALSPPVAALVHTTRRFHGDPPSGGTGDSTGSTRCAPSRTGRRFPQTATASSSSCSDAAGWSWW